MEIGKFLEEYQKVRYSRKYSNRISISSLVHYGDMSLARIHFLKIFSLSVSEMLTMIEYFREQKNLLENEYSDTLESEAQRVFGRPWTFSDYKISAIGCSEFSTEAKDKLRVNRHNFHLYHSAIICLNYVIRYHKER